MGIAELRRITQQVHSEDISARIVRVVSIYFTWVFIKMGASANQVSALNLAIASLAGAALFFPGIMGLVGCLLFFSVNTILDGVDGEVARYRRATSLNGLFLDRINSLFLYPLIFMGLAWRSCSSGNPWELAPALGVVAAVWVIGIRYVRAIADVTVVDGLTQAKATRDNQQTGPAFGSLSEGVRKAGRLRWLVDFFTLRQPGFNIVLAAILSAQVLYETETMSTAGFALPIWLIASAALYFAGAIFALIKVLRSGYIDTLVDRIRGV